MSEAEGNGNGSIRRWVDKAFVATVAGLIALTGFIYTNLAASVERLDQEQRVHSHRITSIEKGNDEILRRLDRIEEKVDRIVEKQK